MKKPLFIFEMANNHMGDLSHGIKIIQELKQITKNIDKFDFSVKLQLRDDSFIHPEHVNRKDHKLIKRFTETKLGEDFVKLIDEIKKNNFITMCTPWDELATQFLSDIDIDIMKVASCSFNDWHLLESVGKFKKKIIASTAGAKKIDIDKVYSLFKNKNKDFSFMHCVGEYPTPDENLELNQIDYLKKNYPDIEIGYSTHEKPDNYLAIAIAIAKGANIFEKHVGLKNDTYDINSYSATPEMVKEWLDVALRSYKILGKTSNKRKDFSIKEIADLRILHRGVYAKKIIKKNSFIKKDDFFLAMPNIEEQIVAKELGKFISFKAKKDFKTNEPLMLNDFEQNKKIHDLMDIRFLIKDRIKEKINLSTIVIPKKVKVEIYHHNGIENFFDIGAILFHIINKEYSKIIVMMFENQKYPSHYHVEKNETYFILEGDLEVNVDNKIINLNKGDTYTVTNNTVHSFRTKKGVIFEEIATKYIKGDSKYTGDIQLDKKTEINIFD